MITKVLVLDILKSYIELFAITLLIYFIGNSNLQDFSPVALWLIPITIFMIVTGLDKKAKKIFPNNIFK